MKRLILLSCITLLIRVGGSAQEATWVADKAHTQVLFTVSHLLIADVTGRFGDFDITLTQKNEDFSESGLSAEIRTASVNTDNETRDGHLRSDDFFNAEKFPAITFEATSFEKVDKDRYKITGDLTIRDITRSVVLDTEYTGSVKGPGGKTRAAFKASTAINRFDYDVRWDKTLDTGGLVVGESVMINLLVELIQM
jgi:polyisoprenoid-binding protein YceI